MPSQADIDAINALPLNDDARRRALRKLELDAGAQPDLMGAMQDAVAPPVTEGGALGRDLPSAEREARRVEQERAENERYELRKAARQAAGEPNFLLGTPAAGVMGSGGAPVVEPEAPTPPPAPAASPAAPEQPAAATTDPAKAFDPYAPRNAGPRLPTTLGAQRQGPVQVTQEQFRTGLATPDEQLEGEQRIERMGQNEGEIAAAQQERAFEATELDRGALEQQRRAVEAQQVAQEEKFLLDLSEKQEQIDQLREKRSAVPKGERKIEGFWDNVAGWLAVLGGEQGGKVIDEIANKEIVKYDRERALFDDEIKGQAEDFDRVLAAQPSRRAALELTKTVKFTQIARKLDQKLNEADSDEQRAAISLARDHATARAQEARLKWRQAYGDTAVTQVSRTTGVPITSKTITPTEIGEARKSQAEERFMQAMAGQEASERGRQAVISGEAVPTTGATEETVPDAATREALGLPEPKRASVAAAKPVAKAAPVEREAPPQTQLSLEAQPNEDAAAHYDRIAQDPNVRNFLAVMTKKYEAAGVPPGRAWVRALNDASGGNYYGEPTASGEHSDLKKSVTVNGQRLFASDSSRAQSYENILNGVELARDGIADWNRFSQNAGRKLDADARAAAAVALNKFNGLIEATTAGGVLSPEEIKERKSKLPDPATFTDITQFNAALARAWGGLAEIIEQRVMGKLTLDPEGRYPAQKSSGFVRTE